MPLLLALALAAAPQAVPPEALPETPSRSAGSMVLIGAGAVTLYVAYGTPVAVAGVYGLLVAPFIAAAHNDVPKQPFLLLLPIAGPILLARVDGLSGQRGLQTLLVVDGAAQLVGLGLLIAGLSPSRHGSRVQPWVTPGGLGLRARF